MRPVQTLSRALPGASNAVLGDRPDRLARRTRPGARRKPRPLTYDHRLVPALARRLRAGGVRALTLALYDLLAVGVKLPAARGRR